MLLPDIVAPRDLHNTVHFDSQVFRSTVPFYQHIFQYNFDSLFFEDFHPRSTDPSSIRRDRELNSDRPGTCRANLLAGRLFGADRTS